MKNKTTLLVLIAVFCILILCLKWNVLYVALGVIIGWLLSDTLREKKVKNLDEGLKSIDELLKEKAAIASTKLGEKLDSINKEDTAKEKELAGKQEKKEV